MASIIENFGGILLTAMGKTLIMALYGLFFACIIGLIFGILSVLKNKVCNVICEYALQKNYNDAIGAYFAEHEKAIIKGNALQILAQL